MMITARTPFVLVSPGTVVDLERKLRVSRGRFEPTASMGIYGSQSVRVEHDASLSADRLLVPLTHEQRTQLSLLREDIDSLRPFVSNFNRRLFELNVNIRLGPGVLDIILVTVRDDLDLEASILKRASVAGDIETAKMIAVDIIYEVGDPALWGGDYIGGHKYSVVRLFAKDTIAKAVSLTEQVRKESDGLVLISEEGCD